MITELLAINSLAFFDTMLSILAWVSWVLIFPISIILVFLILARPTAGEGLSTAFGGGMVAPNYGVRSVQTVDRIIATLALIALFSCIFIAYETRTNSEAGAAGRHVSQEGPITEEDLEIPTDGGEDGGN
ncbi:MAG: preprotein translocase subunit SecG [Planctomycetes bacterium]|nr:preprotein translocase subunit SecG [Planctomycetota bacterium]